MQSIINTKVGKGRDGKNVSLPPQPNKRKKEKKNDASDTFHRVTWGDLVFSQTERDQLP